MDQQPFIMDIKLDGERLSVHIDNTTVGSGASASSSGGSFVTYTTPVLMYTRRRNDYSEQYAPLGELIRESVRVAAGTCVLFVVCFMLYIVVEVTIHMYGVLFALSEVAIL